MINKQNMWFLTLFSLILVLSIYYVTMPEELLLTNNSQIDSTSTDTNEITEPTISIQESSIIETMQVEQDSEIRQTINELNQTLTNMNISIEERNKAYEELQNINKTSGQEEKLEKKLKDQYSYETFVKITGNQIRIVVGTEEGNTELANKIMRSIQEEFTEKKYISVQFTT